MFFSKAENWLLPHLWAHGQDVITYEIKKIWFEVLRPTNRREYTLTENPSPPVSGVVRTLGSPPVENFTYSYASKNLNSQEPEQAIGLTLELEEDKGEVRRRSWRKRRRFLAHPEDRGSRFIWNVGTYQTSDAKLQITKEPQCTSTLVTYKWTALWKVL
jgi:hypothetical protein